MSNSLSCCYCQNIALAFFVVVFSSVFSVVFSFVQNSWVFSKRWQSMVSDSEVGTFDRHLMRQQTDVIWHTQYCRCTACTFLLSDLGLFKCFINSVVCLTLLEITLLT